MMIETLTRDFLHSSTVDEAGLDVAELLKLALRAVMLLRDRGDERLIVLRRRLHIGIRLVVRIPRQRIGELFQTFVVLADHLAACECVGHGRAARP